MADDKEMNQDIHTSDENTSEEMVNETVEDSVEEVENTTEACESEEEAEDEAEDAEASGEKKRFFKKKDKKDKNDEMIEELTDKYRRTFAEFDNFRKRSEKEKAAMFEIGAKSIVEKILPVVDNFERGFKAVSEEERATPFAEGMDKIYKQLITTLSDMGVKEIEAEGKEFDPDFHNAVMHVEDEAYGENIVVEVLQKGYMYKDSVVRHSMVKVAN